MRSKSIYLMLCLVIQYGFLSTITAQGSSWKIIKPTNTGIPGEIVRLGKFDPQGNLWVAARWPFWGEGGVAKYDGTKWTAYSNVDSWMPSDIVNSIAFQTNGVAWIGTDSGLVRFDGSTAQLFNMNNAPFPSNNISSVNVDGSGNIWFISKSVTTTAHGVIKYDGSTWTVYDASNSGIPYFDITTIGIDPANRLWVGTWALGIAMFDGSQWTVYNSGNSNFNGGEVSGFEFTPNGDVWVTSSGSGIYKFSNNVWENVAALPGNHSYSTVSLHPNGTLWFGTYGGLLVKYDGLTFTPYNYGNHLYSIDFDSQGNVWAGGLAFIRKYVNGENTLTYNVYNTSLTSYFIDGLDFEQNGKAWFATSMGGVCSYNGIVWDGYNPYNQGFQPWTFLNNSANDIFVDKQNGNVWVASNGVGYWNGTSWTIFNLSNSNIPDNEETNVTKDNKNRIWIGTEGYGAAFYDGYEWTRLNFGSYTSNSINDIQYAPDGSVWFASDYGLHKTTDGINFISFDQSNSGLPGNYINAIAFEQNGTMWVGTENGLAKLVNNVWTVYNESNSGLPANFVSDIELGSQGIIWVSGFNTQLWPYYGGIAKFNGTNWTTYTPLNSPLTHIQVERLKLDPSGNLWISTYSEGLMKFIQPPGIPLPVSIFSFTGQKISNKVRLDWKTSFEENSDRFVVERANDSLNFTVIGSVTSSGFSQEIKTYSFIDEIPVRGNNYYRLKLIDHDGSFTYSKVITIKFDPNNSGLILLSNPVHSSLTLSYTGKQETVLINIYDASGKLVIREKRTNEAVIKIGVEKLRAGNYFIELVDAVNTYRQRFLKLD
jgi:ligand-binding sensor domain-containing protein